MVEALLSQASLPARPRILDAGCGTGGNLGRYAQIGETRGVDPSPEAVGCCRERGFESVLQAGLEDLPFADDSFDLIVSTDVIEHIDAEQEALRELLRVTVPGGTMVLTVPAYMWMWTEEDDNLHHKRRYTRKRLLMAASRAGWKPQLTTYFNSLLLPAVATVRALPSRGKERKSDMERTPKALNEPLSWPMRLEAHAIRAGLKLPAGVSIAMICSKPG